MIKYETEHTDFLTDEQLELAISPLPTRPIPSAPSRVRVPWSATIRRPRTMSNIDMKTFEITDADLELVSAAGDEADGKAPAPR